MRMNLPRSLANINSTYSPLFEKERVQDLGAAECRGEKCVMAAKKLLTSR